MYCKLRTIFQKTETGASHLRTLLINNKSGQVVWSSFENKKRINSESFFDEIINNFTSIKATESIALISIFA